MLESKTFCKECGCQTGGGAYCFEHSPSTIWRLKDGSWYEDKNGQRTHCYPKRDDSGRALTDITRADMADDGEDF